MSSLRENPFGLFLTWTTYGTWLPGDERGYVSNTLLPEGGFRRKENRIGAEYDRDSVLTRTLARQQQRHETIWLNREQSLVAAGSFLDAALERGWQIPRCAVMSNHVHVLVTHSPDDASSVLRILKGCSQQALSVSYGRPRRWWTHRGSKRYLHDHEGFDAVSRYIEQQKSILALIRDNEIVP
jgi:REP element-mobilizing transposase RayT